MPIFCIDFLFCCNKTFLLLKRTDEPLKGVFWPPGGRLRFREEIDHMAFRIQTKEIGTYYEDYKIVGFSNYFFENCKNNRALHTPTILYKIEIDKKFNPILDKSHSDFIWSNELPSKLLENTTFIDKV